MVIGIFTSDVGATCAVMRALRMRTQKYLLMGCARAEPFGAVRYQHFDLSDLSNVLFEPEDEQFLRRSGVRQIANVGTFGSMLDAADVCRNLLDLRPIPNRDRHILLPFAESIERSSMRVRWLRDLVPSVRPPRRGRLNRTECPVPMKEVAAAVARAKNLSRASRCSTTVIDEGGVSQVAFQTDQRLKLLAKTMPTRPRLLLMISGHPNHCPLDPPLIGEKTIENALDAHVSVIVIDFAKGAIWDKDATLRRANQHNICVIAA